MEIDYFRFPGRVTREQNDRWEFSVRLSRSLQEFYDYAKKKVTTFNLWTNLTSNAAQNRPEYVCFVWSKFLFPNGLVSGGSCKMFASFLPPQSSVVMNCWSPLTLALFLHSAPAVEEILLSVIYVHLQPYRLSPTNKCFMSAQTACAGESTHFT